MDIKEISKDRLLRKYKVIISKKDVDLAIENKAQEIAKTAEVPGFRVGKVPSNMIKTRYENQIKSDLANHFVESGVNKIVKENNFDLVERPTINALDFKNDGELVFEVEFQLLPKMPEIDFSKIKLTKYVTKVSPEEVKKALAELQKKNAILNSVHGDIAVEVGNVVLIDADGYIDGKAFSEGKVRDYKLKIGSKQFIEGFEDGLIGSKVGEEKTLNLKFPKDYHAKNYADKNVTFTAKVKEIFKEEIPKLDDEFAKKFNLKNLSELREAAKKSAQGRLDQFSKLILKKELFDKLNKDIKIELPPKLLQRELKFVTESSKQDDSSQSDQKIVASKEQKKAKGKKIQSSEEISKNQYEEVAKRRVKLGLLVNSIAKKEKISLSQKDLSDEVMLQLQANPESASLMVKHYKENPQALEPLKGKILEDKVVSFILNSAVLQEKNVTAEELKILYSKTS